MYEVSKNPAAPGSKAQLSRLYRVVAVTLRVPVTMQPAGITRTVEKKQPDASARDTEIASPQGGIRCPKPFAAGWTPEARNDLLLAFFAACCSLPIAAFLPSKLRRITENSSRAIFESRALCVKLWTALTRTVGRGSAVHMMAPFLRSSLRHRVPPCFRSHGGLLRRSDARRGSDAWLPRGGSRTIRASCAEYGRIRSSSLRPSRNAHSGNLRRSPQQPVAPNRRPLIPDRFLPRGSDYVFGIPVLSPNQAAPSPSLGSRQPPAAAETAA
jgi:hypothetical protein